jgi:predicted dehydrogenase
MKPILRAIHIGVGRRGEWPLRLANPAAGFQPVALVDSDPQMVAAARQICGDVPGFATIAEAALAVKADVAIICSPTRFHLEHASACLAAGLHVLTEKGLAPNLADAQTAVDRARAAKRALCVAQNYRYQAMERTVARMLRDPSHPQFAGAPYLVEYTQNRQRPHPRTLDYPFASVWDMSCHHFDNLLFWLGPGFTRLTAEAFGPTWSRYRHPSNTSVQATHAVGCFVHYLHTHNAAVNEIRIRIQAERGAILVDEDRVSFCPRADVQFQHEPIVPVTREQHLGEAGVLADFHRHCTTGEPVGISGAANLTVMALCDATCRSVESRGPVQVG